MRGCFGADHQPVKVAVDAPAGVAGRQLPVGGIPIEKPPIAELR